MIQIAANMISIPAIISYVLHSAPYSTFTLTSVDILDYWDVGSYVDVTIPFCVNILG